MIEQSKWVVQTKYLVPQLHPDIIKRPRLVDVLVEAVQKHPLTLLSAPAGSGKTTLMAALPQALPAMPLGWLALDEDDNQLNRFLAALIGVFRHIRPDCGTRASSLLETLSDPLAEARQVLGTLINEVLEQLNFPFIVALDDLHLITQPYCYDLLNYLLEHQPPQMHLVLTTRYDPPLILPKLRARRQAAELRLTQLRFTLEETRLFLTRTLPANISPAYSEALQQYTEGWATGLSLLVTSLERLPSETDRSSFIQALGSSESYIFEFLAQEVLNQLDPPSRQFLLQTAILAELNPELCNAVTGRVDGQVLLEQLYRRNLFLIALAGPVRTYRYHDLFREFLLQQLARETPVEEISRLHLRAGQTETSVERSLRHYLAGKHWQEATNLLERYGEQYIEQGVYQQLYDWARTLPAAQLQENPRLLYLSGVCEFNLYNVTRAIPLFEAARTAFAARGDGEAEGETMVFLVTCLGRATRFEEAARMSRAARAYPLPPHRRAQLLVGAVYQAVFLGNVAEANRDLQEAFELVHQTGDRRAISILALDLMVVYMFQPGIISRMESFLELLGRTLDEYKSPLLLAQYYKIQALCLLAHGQHQAAYQAAEKAIQGAEDFGGLAYGRLCQNVGMILTVCPAWAGDEPTSTHWSELVLREIESRAEFDLFKAFVHVNLFYLGRVRCQQKRLAEAEQIYRQLLVLPQGGNWPYMKTIHLLLASLIALYRGELEVAEAKLVVVDQAQEKLPYIRIYSDARYLLAFIDLKRKNPGRALSRLEAVLSASAALGIENLILLEGPEIARPLLQLAVEKGGGLAKIAGPVLAKLASDPAGGAPAPASNPAHLLPIPVTGETLTAREVEVLELLATGANNTEIAEQLVISLHTVKIHVSRILAKLAASSRSAAVAHAREYGLL